MSIWTANIRATQSGNRTASTTGGMTALTEACRAGCPITRTANACGGPAAIGAASLSHRAQRRHGIHSRDGLNASRLARLSQASHIPTDQERELGAWNNIMAPPSWG